MWSLWNLWNDCENICVGQEKVLRHCNCHSLIHSAVFYALLHFYPYWIHIIYIYTHIIVYYLYYINLLNNTCFWSSPFHTHRFRAECHILDTFPTGSQSIYKIFRLLHPRFLTSTNLYSSILWRCLQKLWEDMRKYDDENDIQGLYCCSHLEANSSSTSSFDPAKYHVPVACLGISAFLPQHPETFSTVSMTSRQSTSAASPGCRCWSLESPGPWADAAFKHPNK